MKKYITIGLSGLLLLFAFSACGNKDDDPNPGQSDAYKTNTWIYDIMVKNYYWYEEVEKKKESLDFEEKDTESFFKKLLSQKDGVTDSKNKHLYYFSYIEKKRESSKAISDLDLSYGFEYLAFPVTGKDYYYILVLYILPNSPAEKSGLKRGDWIFSIDSDKDNIYDYKTVGSGNGGTFHIGRVNPETGRLTAKGTIAMPTAEYVMNDPLYKDSIYEIGDRKIGYLVYNHFSKEPDGVADGSYDKRMKEFFANFSSQGINEFVLDLRYNGGGLVTCAQLLSSFLVPKKDITQIFCTLKYNNKMSAYNRNLQFDGSVSSSNLNLNRVYFLVSGNTASASEAVINSLTPFMGKENIILIGDQTVGKGVGSNQYGEDEKWLDWILHPITLTICNSEGKADYNGVGFTPDIYLNEYQRELQNQMVLRDLGDFGDTNELFLKTAIQHITGQSTFRSEELPADYVSSPVSAPVYSSLSRNPSGLIVRDSD